MRHMVQRQLGIVNLASMRTRRGVTQAVEMPQLRVVQFYS